MELKFVALCCVAGHSGIECAYSSSGKCGQTCRLYDRLGDYLPNTDVTSHGSCIICNHTRLSGNSLDNVR